MAGREPLPPPLKWAGESGGWCPACEKCMRCTPSGASSNPFVGGLSVALGLLPKRALLSDINPT